MTVISRVGNIQYLTKYTGFQHAFSTQWQSCSPGCFKQLWWGC